MPFLYLLQKNHIYQMKHIYNRLSVWNINMLSQGMKV